MLGVPKYSESGEESDEDNNDVKGLIQRETNAVDDEGIEDSTDWLQDIEEDFFMHEMNYVISLANEGARNVWNAVVGSTTINHAQIGRN